ncbi:MAG: hypothetical protein ACOYB4_10010, partial [Methyloceanibacter sp.]
MRLTMSCFAAVTAALLLWASFASAEDAGSRSLQLAQAEGPMVITPHPNPGAPHAVPNQRNYLPPPDASGPGVPYEPAPGTQPYVPPEAQDQGTFSMDEIKETGHRFFGKVSMGFARVVE